jgi:hypothetical protein
LALALVLFVAAGVGQGWRLLASLDQRAVGDGRTLESYGYNLTTLLVPRERLYPIGIDLRKDGMPALDHPARISARELGEYEKLGGVRKLLASERVIGVEFDGQAVAYPLWILDWHEIVNDTVGGRAILVTYNGICDSAVVFDRDVDGGVREFGFSGLLLSGNLVMYDRQDDSTGESLWSQLQMRAIAGPCAERRIKLSVLPFELAAWKNWSERHPDTEVLLPARGRKRLYKRDAYSKYRSSDELKFPVEPLPADGRAYKTPIVATWRGDVWVVIEDQEPIPSDASRVYSYWFAWYAAQAD